MKFNKTSISGAYLIELEKIGDERGFFARAWCQNEFQGHNLVTRFVQCNLSFNKRRNTLRGMHYQSAPLEEVKLVRCTRGAVFDVIIDLRPESPTYLKWIGVELTAENYRMLFVPKMFAHGFQTLEDDCVVTYQVGQYYTPGSERGICYNDAVFGIQWPLEVSAISDKDRKWPGYIENAK